MIPLVDEQICTHCGICSDICEYNAIISLAETVLVFPELCHSCYGCLELCPEGAISEGFKTIGEISIMETSRFNLISGRLKVSESATAALISKTRKTSGPMQGNEILEIYDAPPGSSCPLIEAVKGMDYVLLVGEPTPFGLHDMDLVVQTLRQLDIPFGVVINKAMTGNTLIQDYCLENTIPVWAEIPQDMDIARTYARGELVSEQMPEIEEIFGSLFSTLISKKEGVCP